LLKGFSDEFELEACLYSDKSSSRLKQQYKDWLSTMKKESGALFKKVSINSLNLFYKKTK
jgi:hypothetical protein